jgi:hypothetical protein
MYIRGSVPINTAPIRLHWSNTTFVDLVICCCTLLYISVCDSCEVNWKEHKQSLFYLWEVFLIWCDNIFSWQMESVISGVENLFYCNCPSLENDRFWYLGWKWGNCKNVCYKRNYNFVYYYIIKFLHILIQLNVSPPVSFLPDLNLNIKSSINVSHRNQFLFAWKYSFFVYCKC